MCVNSHRVIGIKSIQCCTVQLTAATAMPLIFAQNSDELGKLVRQHSEQIYNLLVVAARPVLEHGTSNEDPCLNI